MDAAGYLKRHGWRGDGHSLDHTGRGIRKPLLVSKKVDVLGVGLNKHAAVSDQWWMRAFDQGLKDLGTGKKSALADVREKGMAYGGLYGRFVKGEGVAGTFGEAEAESNSSRKRKREDDPQKPGSSDKKVKTNAEALEKNLNRDVRRFVSEAIRRGLISGEDEKVPGKRDTDSGAVSKFGEAVVAKVFTKAGILGADSSKTLDHQDKYNRGKLQRAVKRAAREFLVSRFSADEQRTLGKDASRSKVKPKSTSREELSEKDDKTAAKEAKALRKQERRAKKSTEQTGFETNADEVKISTSSKTKSKTIPGVGAVDRYPTKAEKKAKKQGRKDKENTTPESTPSEDTNNLGFITDTKGDAGLEGRSSSSDSLSVIDSDGNVRYTCKPGQVVPLDPTIWTGIKPKLLPKPVRKARSEYMSERREARQARKAKKVKVS
ncbi:hypothetical protein PRZ48_004432 [Zasmidium cellare]|uniref:Uncharacterized protein n=1 Tax=Zasmidium cellare TaxID=395010 RepID=A0ABR0EPR9_ZASCE|nr:hypothetical protein PRZ48_004432 [Zasmidium cellare]